MSRICVKNLPKYVAEDRLREFFSKKGEVTDAKIMRTKEGASRQFGFVGFRTEQEADEAIRYFNRTYMDTVRITCEIARRIGDSDIPRPWSRHSLKKTEKGVTSLTVSERKNKKSKKDDRNNDPQLEEFLQVMQHRSKSKMWANDTLAAPTLEQGRSTSDEKFLIEKGHKKNTDREGSNLDDFKGEGISFNGNQEADKPNILVSDKVVSDRDYFRSRINTKWSDRSSQSSVDESDHSDSDDIDDNGDSHIKSNHGPIKDTVESGVDVHVPIVSEGDAEEGSGEDGNNGPDGPMPSPGNMNDVLEFGRLFIRNLPYSATTEDLEDHFSKYGIISHVHIVTDKETRRSKGIAYVLFATPECAVRALEEMDSSTFQGRLLHVMPAKPKKLFDMPESNILSKTFKQQRDAGRKASEATGNIKSWNTLFMHSDTIAENIVRKLGISKNELLDRESDDLAVKFALGETQVIADTKKALASAGVNVSSLEKFATGKTDGLKRSNHVILVKNLPYGSSEQELSDMFGKFGGLDKIILPPTKTLAVVMFVEPADAKAAFKGLSYKRYKNAPLYLEWAPGNILSQVSTVGDNNAVGELDAKKAFLDQQVENITDADVDPDRVESRSLYVKNLNFKTTEESVRRHFTECMKEGKLLTVKVKKHVKNGKNVSMGYGFIEFDSIDTAMNACKELQGTVLDGHALILQLCHAKKDEALPKKIENDRSSTKLIVRNVAFEATKKDLRQLFSPFGQIKRLRLPMKFGNHRGFAFVEYVTKQEARNALEALSNTHLYGRHLVLERAKEGESLEELRARTAAQFTDSAKLSNKRRHFAEVSDEGNVKFQRISE